MERAAVVELQTATGSLGARLSQLGADDTEGRLRLQAELDKSLATLSQKKARLTAEEKILGVDDKKRLTQLKGNPYLRARMNARVLKERIRARVRDHKFVRTGLERAYRHQISRRYLHILFVFFLLRHSFYRRL